jgi:hypothetical protein
MPWGKGQAPGAGLEAEARGDITRRGCGLVAWGRGRRRGPVVPSQAAPGAERWWLNSSYLGEDLQEGLFTPASARPSLW